MESLAGRFVLLSGWRRSATACAAGAIASLAQAPFDFFAACFLAFPVLVWLLDGIAGGGGVRSRIASAFFTGWWFGFGYFVAGLWWIGNALLVDAAQFAWAWPLAVVGLPAVLAIFYGLATALAALFRFDGIFRIVALALAFGFAEWLRTFVLTGFPWNAVGYAAMPTTLTMQSANLIGLTGLNALAVLVFSVPALLGTRRHLAIGIAVAAVCVVVQLSWGLYKLSGKETFGRMVSIRIVQPSVLQTEKWDEKAQNRIFERLLELSSGQGDPGGQGGGPDLIVWPETAVPFLFSDRPDALVRIGEMLGEHQMLLAGAVRAEGDRQAVDRRYYNAVVAIGSSGEIVDAVDKVHLVPFGEYLPLKGLLTRLGVERITQSVGPFSPGSGRHPILVSGDVRAAPFICYEAIFPALVNEMRDADFLLNLTNDAWYGVTQGPYQHFRQARLRAVETGLPLVRAANNGISAVVDGRGRIIDALALNGIGTLDVELRLGKSGTFSFSDPGTNGAAVLLCLGGVLLAAGTIRRIRAN